MQVYKNPLLPDKAKQGIVTGNRDSNREQLYFTSFSRKRQQQKGKDGKKMKKETQKAPTLAAEIIGELSAALKDSLHTLEKVRKDAENIVSVCEAQERQIRELISEIKAE